MLKLLILASLLVSYASGTGPKVKASKGEVWPKPQQEEKTEDYFIVRPHTFSFKPPADIGCPNFLADAFTRYWSIIAISSVPGRRRTLLKRPRESLGDLQTLTVELGGECGSEDVLPALGDDESYTLSVSAGGATLSAPTIWGVLRGLETFSQLIYSEEDVLIVNATSITDFPRMTHRGLLLDTARHFIPVPIILQTLDAMAFNKFNVFHWHITDDESFPYKSTVFPELSDQGAYHPVLKVYEQSDVRRVIEYARLRGIRVVPEFDTPGHTSSWGLSHPEVLTTCYLFGEVYGELGPMDPTKTTTIDFLINFYEEIVEVFPDLYIHSGGDEVNFDCWTSNQDVKDFMTMHNMTMFKDLQNYFSFHLVEGLGYLGRKSIVWEEVFVNGAEIINGTLVQLWKDHPAGFDVLLNVTAAGIPAIVSRCWYLDQLSSGGDWEKFYECDAQIFGGTDEQIAMVLGGEACLWSEAVNEYNVISRTWPRASATAEKLWSAMSVNDTEAARPRIEEHTCRLNKRGIAAQPPNGPGVCL